MFKKNLFICLLLVAQFFLIAPALAANGDVLWSQTSATAVPSTLAIDSSYTYTAGNRIAIVKRNIANGSLVWSVANATFDVRSVAVDSTGLYLAGSVNTGGVYNYTWRVEKRSLVDGSIIWSRAIHPSTSGFDSATSIGVDATGVYVAGIDQSPNNASASGYQWRIEKLNLSTGAAIWTQVANANYSYSDSVARIAVDSTGVYVLGHTAPSGSWVMRVEKRNLTTGALIWGQNTAWVGPIGTHRALAIDGTGIYLGGSTSVETGSYYDEYLAEFVPIYTNFLAIEKRNLTTGAIIWSITEDFGGGDSMYTYAMTADPGGLFIGAHINDTRMRIESRSTTNGALSWAVNGPITGSTGDTLMRDLRSDATSLYAVGYISVVGSTDGITEKRMKGGSCTGPFAASWTDPTLTANSTKIRKVHIDELRTAINTRRVDAGLGNYSWTDPTLTANSTKIRKVHIDELRTAIAQVYSTCGQAAPSWTDPTLTANSTKIRKVHIDELRTVTANAL